MSSRFQLWARRLTTGGFLLVIALGIPASVFAGDPTPQPEKETSISFMDDRPLTVDLDWLKAQHPPGVLEVRVRNNTQVSQTIELSLEGLVPPLSDIDDDAALRSFYPRKVASQELGAGVAGTLTLSFNVTDPVFTKSSSYPGLLVATSNPGGDLIRRDFTLNVKVEDESETVQEAAEAAKITITEQLSELTLVGTNFIPSLLNPLTPALVWLGLTILLLCAIALRPWLTRLHEGKDSEAKTERRDYLFLALALVGVALIAGGAIRAVRERAGVIEPIEPALVYVEPVGMPAGVKLGPVAADNGSQGLLKQTDNGVEVALIPRAGVYKGSIDLLPEEEEKGNVTVTVNVADWWPYALLTITLGVIAGYTVMKYYKERPRRAFTLAAKDLLERIAELENQFQNENSGKPFADYTMMEMAKTAKRKAEAAFDSGVTEEAVKVATGRLDKLDKYAQRVGRFREELVRLYSLSERLSHKLKTNAFGVQPNGVDAYRNTQVLLKGSPLRDHDDDCAEDKSVLGQRTQETETLVGWVQALVFALDALDAPLDEVKKVSLNDPDDGEKKRAHDAYMNMVGCGAAMLRANDAKEARDQEDAALETYHRWKFRRPPVKGRVKPKPAPEDTAAGPPEEEDIKAPSTLEQLREALYQSDWQMTMITGLLAIGSGFAALYLKADVVAWGTPYDYLWALLWGAVVSEGSKVVASLVQGMWPPK